MRMDNKVQKKDVAKVKISSTSQVCEECGGQNGSHKFPCQVADREIQLITKNFPLSLE